MSNYRHGMRHTRIYDSWASMIGRCRNQKDPAYKNYGGRGIDVCERWLKFENFYADMGDKPDGMTLERKDNEKGYCKDNCIWADRTAQSRNRRNLHMIEIDGASKCIGEWSEIYGVKVKTICQRIRNGWTKRDAVTIPTLRQMRGVPRTTSLKDLYLKERDVRWTDGTE